MRQAVPDAEPTTVTLDSDPRVSASVALGQRGTVFVNPYTGDVLGSGSARARAFYRSVTSWHRYLSVEGEHRATARAITGACNAAFLVLAVTGFYLWWPRQWTWRHVSAVTLFRSGLRGKARDFNWHNVIGFWCAPILVVLTASGMVISYTWASNLVYTLTGSPRPAAAAGRGGGPAGERGEAGGRGGGRGGGLDRGPSRNDAGRAEPGRAEQNGGDRAPRAPDADAGPRATLDSLVARAERQVPTWRTMIIRLPPRAGRPGGLLDVRPRVLEQLRALDADPRRTHGRRRPLGALRGHEPRAESPRMAALRAHGRARRTARRSSSPALASAGGGVSRLYRRGARAATARGVAFAASRGLGAAAKRRRAAWRKKTRRILSVSKCRTSAAFLSSPSSSRPPAWRCRPQTATGTGRSGAGPRAPASRRLAKPPVEWSETKNIRWKKEIPGRGAGTPVIWGDLLFVSTAVPVGASDAEAHAARGKAPGAHKYVVMALDRKDGRVVWERVVREDTPHEAAHQEWGTWASPSIVTDGTHVIASFESRGIYAFDMKGTPVWQKDLGDKSMRNQFGEGSSPALHGNTLVIVWDHQGASFIIALDKRTGDERWRTARDEIDSWATPLIVEYGTPPYARRSSRAA